MTKRKTRQQIQEIKTSAKNAIEHILLFNNVSEEHKKKLIDLLIWIISEAEGKYKIPHVSDGVVQIEKSSTSKKEKIKNLRFEHVYKRENLKNQILSKEINAETLIERSIGCLVTLQEHSALHALNEYPEIDGWQRYEKAKIKVFERKYDLLTGRETYEPCPKGFSHC